MKENYKNNRKTKYYGRYFRQLFLSSTGISDAKNKNHPLWDQKSSLFLGSEIVEARNQRIWWFLSPEITALSNLSELKLFDFWILPRTKYHMSPLPILYLVWYLSAVLVTYHPQQRITNTPTTAYRACCVRDRALSSHKRDSSSTTTIETTTGTPHQQHSRSTATA